MGVFEWDVDRIIFSIGFLEIRWYSLCFAAGFLNGYFYLKRVLQREGKDPEILDSVLTYAIFGTIIGARLVHCLFYEADYYLSRPLEILYVWKGGLASHGGFAGLVTGLYLVARQYRTVSVMWLIDRCCPSGMIAAGFIRLGNFFNSEIIGRPTDGSWGVIFKRLSEADQIPRHPTQLYEAAGYIAIGTMLHLLYTRKRENTLPGQLFGTALILGFSYRFFIEFYKENQTAFENGWWINMGQALSVPFVLLGIYILTESFRQSPLGQRLSLSSGADSAEGSEKTAQKAGQNDSKDVVRKTGKSRNAQKKRRR